jgi:hypothetical protein
VDTGGDLKFFTDTDLHKCRMKSMHSVWLKSPRGKLGEISAFLGGECQSPVLSCHLLVAEPVISLTQISLHFNRKSPATPLPTPIYAVPKQLHWQRALLSELPWSVSTTGSEMLPHSLPTLTPLPAPSARNSSLLEKLAGKPKNLHRYNLALLKLFPQQPQQEGLSWTKFTISTFYQEM